MRSHHALWIIALLLLAPFALASTGCDDYPKDPEDTYEEILREDVLWAGLSEHPPWTQVDDGRPSGVEVELVEGLAEELGVELRWLVMTESELVDSLQHGEIDLAVAGFRKSSPWRKHVGFTNAYATVHGKPRVMAVRAGENRWLMRVEDHLRGREGEVRRALERQDREVIR